MSRQYVRCRVLSIPGKFNVSVRIMIDNRTEFRSLSDSGENIALTLSPAIETQIVRPRTDPTAGPRIWNPNDSLMLSKFTLPLFLQDLDAVVESLKLTEMFVYTGDRLELNPKLAEEKRRIFRANQSFYVEIIPTVVESEEKRVEGIRLTFNKEPSQVSLTIPEIDSYRFTLKNLQPDIIALLLFNHYWKTGTTEMANPFPPQF